MIPLIVISIMLISYKLLLNTLYFSQLIFPIYFSFILFACLFIYTFVTRYLLAIVKSMEEKNKTKRRKTRVENPVAGLVNDENSDEEHKKRVKLPSAVFTKRDDGKKGGDEEPTRKAVLMELFTKTGIAKAQVR